MPSSSCRRGAVVTRAGENFYSVLGVEKGAEKKAIKSAYRQKVRFGTERHLSGDNTASPERHILGDKIAAFGRQDVIL